jgi:hypothetical protein
MPFQKTIQVIDISLPEKYYYTLSKSGFKTEKFWLCYIPSLQGLMWVVLATTLCMISDDWKLICVISSLFYADSRIVLSFFYHVQFFHNTIKFTSQDSSLRALYTSREWIYWEGIFAVQTPGTHFSWYRHRENELVPLFSGKGSLIYCNNINELMHFYGIEHDPTQWRLFIDSSKRSLKVCYCTMGICMGLFL